jgi:P4 family phage/plasmid primase-like protien
MLVPNELLAAGLRVFPCNITKEPIVPQGVSWKDLPLEVQRWPAPLIGIQIPEGVVVVDVDRYKGVTPEDIDLVLGCKLPWDEALIQTTTRGGEHYAFRVDYDVRQGSNLLKVAGFDTRVGGKGYICTGAPSYTGSGFGVFRLAQPALLPALPLLARPLLEHVEATSPPAAQALPADMNDVIEALRHIPPDCGRSVWLKIGLALKTVTDDVTLFDQWSSGQLAGVDTPHNYVAEHVHNQWPGFKPDGATTIQSLYWEAIQAGWKPSSRVDTAAAFGSTAGSTVDKILSHGSDPKHTDELITLAAGNPILLAVLTRELKEAGLLTKAVKQRLDLLATGTQAPRASDEYGKNHTENATLYLNRHYPEGGLRRSDETWYRYDGKAWHELQNDDVSHALTLDMLKSLPQDSTVAGTYRILGRLCHNPGVRINEIPDNLILYQNGVLDLSTGVLMAHNPGYFTTNILPYDYVPHATAPRWHAFLNDIFEGDQERIALLQEWFGYMISNSNRYHKILFMLGPSRSGKGIIGKVLEQIVGPYNFSGCELHAFASDSFLESLRTRSVAFNGDVARNTGRASTDVVIARLKGISGGDAISFDRKYKGNISQVLPTRITLSGNNVPNLFDDSGALASRMLILNFNISYLNREDHTIYDQVQHELAGIAAWALVGLQRLTANDRFTAPEAGRVEAEFIADTYSPLRQFVNDRCTIGLDESYKISCTTLYDRYRVWAIAENDSPLSRRQFIASFKDATRGGGVRYGVFAIDKPSERGFSGLTVLPPTSSAFQPAVVAS